MTNRRSRPPRQTPRSRLPAALRWRLRQVAGVLLVTLGALAGPAQAEGEGLEPPAGWRLVWADEFDVDGPPDPRRWVHDTARNREGWYNEERQYYAGPGMDNAVVRGGRLIITARREAPSHQPDWGGQHYTSARLLTRGKAAWTYGFFEVSARMACGQGTWPAIWTLATGGRWPDDGELDIAEYMGRRPHQVSSAVHTRPAHAANSVYAIQPLPDACRSFHRYQMLWTRSGVTFGVDGRPFLHYPRFEGAPGAWPFDEPQFLILNLAIGGWLGGDVDDRIFPTSMEVDYVRVYQAPVP